MRRQRRQCPIQQGVGHPFVGVRGDLQRRGAVPVGRSAHGVPPSAGSVYHSATSNLADRHGHDHRDHNGNYDGDGHHYCDCHHDCDGHYYGDGDGHGIADTVRLSDHGYSDSNLEQCRGEPE